MKKSTIYVRWVNAFRNRRVYSVSEMLSYEYFRNDDACCEAIHYKNKVGYISSISQTSIGILYNKSAVYKKFKADCWSEYVNGKLVATQPARKLKDAGHNENFIHCGKNFIDGIIIEDSTKLESSIIEDIVKFSKENNIVIYELIDGKLIKRNIKTMVRNNHKFHHENSLVINVLEKDFEKQVEKNWIRKEDVENYKNEMILYYQNSFYCPFVEDENEKGEIILRNRWNDKIVLKFIIK